MQIPVLNRIITAYLQSNRRLVIPQLGVFIRKEPGGDVVFSTLLRNDDGVLRGLLAAQRGMSDIEAAGAIARFVFEVRMALQNGERYDIDGLGAFEAADKTGILFRQEQPLERQPIPAADAVAEQDGASVERSDAERSDAAPAAKERQAPVASSDSEPYIKGLRYGKPQKTTDPYTYVHVRKPRRMDRFVVVAIVSALVALGAIVYGYVRQRNIDRQEQLFIEETLRQLDPASAPAAEESLEP